MSVKTTLKTIKLNESLISMVLGAVVIIVAGLLVVNLLGRRQVGTTLPTGEVTENTTSEESGTITRDGKKIHVVAESDNLWKIAEKYYESGYNWVDIAEANQLASSDSITTGQELIIPEVDSRTKTVASADTGSLSPTVADQKIAVGTEATPTITATPSVTPVPTVKAQNTEIENKQTDTNNSNSISGTTYTVEAGDTLWEIAQRAYGDPYRWSDIAEANNLANPNVIHRGNVFTIPR